MSICLCLSIMMAWAQVEARYDKGNVPVVNGRVMFQETIATTLSEGEAYARLNEWAKQRFTKKFFVLDRTRINYWAEFQCTEGGVSIKLTRINYWYEEEREGGIKFSAEEFITDDEAFNAKGTKLFKDQGKFRKGTINFFDSLVAEMNTALTK